ncbi:MAG: hypothetical protein HOW73_22405 [Polyangiaceae bacterium]|nr:hypothetical protein [Polyangiaceae bacterium]
MLDDIESFADFWTDPEKYLLVRLPRNPEGLDYYWVEAVTFGMSTFDYDEAIRSRVIQRMLAAGVQAISLAELRELQARRVWTDADPHWVSPAEPRDAHHVRLSDGRFQRVFRGPDRTLFCGCDHVLASDALTDVLGAAGGENVTCVQAVIFDPETGHDRSGYWEIRPRHELAPRRLRKRTHQADAHVWHFRHEYLFVSPSVATELRRRFEDLELSPGFSQLVGRISCEW